MSLADRVAEVHTCAKAGGCHSACTCHSDCATVKDKALTYACHADEVRQLVHQTLAQSQDRTNAGRSLRQEKNEVRALVRTIIEQRPWLCPRSSEFDMLVNRIIDDMFGMGPIEGLLADESITEIMVNPSCKVFIEREGTIEETPLTFTNHEEVRALIDRIVGPIARRIDESVPMVDARLACGHRVHAIIPPLAIDGPVLTIRKFRSTVMTLDEMVANGSFDRSVSCFLKLLIHLRTNIAVSGGTGSGKTTLLNALSCCIDREERIVTIEDSAELRFLKHPHVIRLEARSNNAEGHGRIAIRTLVTNALRMRPDRIIVGECRGAETIDMLQAMNTGHDGSLTTLHANTPADAVMRLTTMARFSGELPVDVIEAQIASAIGCIVQTTRLRDGRRAIIEIDEVGHDRSRCGVQTRMLYGSKEGDYKRMSWVHLPSWFDAVVRDGGVLGQEAESWKSIACVPS
ncbi:MAG: CpaF family protein [Eggerthellaceae bacterium]|nr:CpaF family protein [Eggerthellaceae bacterium]MCH4221295.1 CpaF family protein [Eggerthellaceae bacterium]